MADKENPRTPTKRGVSTHLSPLKPISPSKGNVGKLTFLQSDNLDEHLNHIHHSNSEIQERLLALEIQLRQTALDLGQLFDRSKNNNQHLGKLLESITNYSNEVITEGNATKNDIGAILARLDELGRRVDVAGAKGREAELAAKLDENNKAVLALLVDLKSSMDEKSNVDDAFEKTRAQDLQDQIKLQEDRYSALRTKTQQEHARFEVLQQQTQHEEQRLAELKKLTSDEQSRLELLLQQTSDREVKLASVQGKYDVLCQAYTSKYRELESLAKEFEQLVRPVTPEPADKDIVKLNKVKKFHNMKMNKIQEEGESSPTRRYKRVMSTPIHYKPDAVDLNSGDE